MVRKVIVGTAVAMLLGFFCFGRDAVSYVRTSAGYMKDSVHNAVPMGFQIDRARGMIKDLTFEVRKNMHLIAKEEVEVEKLQKQVSDLEARLAKEEEEHKKLHTDVKSGKTSFEYGGRKYNAEQALASFAALARQEGEGLFNTLHARSSPASGRIGRSEQTLRVVVRGSEAYRRGSAKA